VGTPSPDGCVHHRLLKLNERRGRRHCRDGTFKAACAVIKVGGVAEAAQGALECAVATKEAGRTPDGNGTAGKAAIGIVKRRGVAVPCGLPKLIAAGAVERGLRGRGGGKARAALR
jgi:hypothetical protein